jgi:hypothetical protein
VIVAALGTIAGLLALLIQDKPASRRGRPVVAATTRLLRSCAATTSRSLVASRRLFGHSWPRRNSGCREYGSSLSRATLEESGDRHCRRRVTRQWRSLISAVVDSIDPTALA